MKKVTLIYPYSHPRNDTSPYRFPPLGLGYLAAYLKKNNIPVELVDCTFLEIEETLEKTRRTHPDIIGIQSMFSMKNKSLSLARQLKDDSELLVAGGPLPTVAPQEFLRDFDVVVIGEGENTLLELVNTYDSGSDFSKVDGIAFRKNGKIIFTKRRKFVHNLDDIPFPARELFDNEAYKEYYKRNFGYTMTPMITSRGCPFDCDFCSKPIFGSVFRSRSPSNIIEEIEDVKKLSYDRIWFADDCLTLNRKRLIDICDGIIQRNLNISWECLSRVDTIDEEVLEKMKNAGCHRVFFGLESGNEKVLRLMNKQITIEKARNAVIMVKRVGIKVGAFFIIGYPGETNETILDTVRFSSSLPLDYVSFTLPYPIPGTPLYGRVKDRIVEKDYESHKHIQLIDHYLLYHSEFSEAKLKFAIAKGLAQSKLRKLFKGESYNILGFPFELVTDFIFRHIN